MAMNFDWKDFLLKHSLFVGLNRKEVERIIEQLLDDKVSNEKEFSEGKLIVREGEPGDSVFLVGSGSVQVVLEGENGHDTPIAILRRGDFFGEMALLEKKPRAATVRAKESCTLLEINGQEFLKLLDEHRDVESKMLLKLSERLRHANEQVMAVRVRSVDDKLEALKVKHEAEMKAVDAQLNAARALFEQTKLRTDEIISSAERSRARTSWFFGIVAMIASLIAGFGLWEAKDLKEHADKASGAMKRITDAAADLRKIDPVIKRFERSSTSLDRLIFLISDQPKFKDTLLKGTEREIDDLYTSLRETHGNHTWFLNDVELAIKERPKRNYAKILEAILNDAQDTQDRIRAQYLLLMTSILRDNMRNFDKQFQDFKSSVEAEGPFTPYDLSSLREVFKNETPERQRRFNQVTKLIPTG